MKWIRELIAPTMRDRMLLSPLSPGMGWVSRRMSQLGRQRFQRVEAMLSHNLDKIAAEYQMSTGDFLFLLTQGYCPPGICVVWERGDWLPHETAVCIQVHDKVLARLTLADPWP